MPTGHNASNIKHENMLSNLGNQVIDTKSFPFPLNHQSSSNSVNFEIPQPHFHQHLVSLYPIDPQNFHPQIFSPQNFQMPCFSSFFQIPPRFEQNVQRPCFPPFFPDPPRFEQNVQELICSLDANISSSSSKSFLNCKNLDRQQIKSNTRSSEALKRQTRKCQRNYDSKLSHNNLKHPTWQDDKERYRRGRLPYSQLYKTSKPRDSRETCNNYSEKHSFKRFNSSSSKAEAIHNRRGSYTGSVKTTKISSGGHRGSSTLYDRQHAATLRHETIVKRKFSPSSTHRQRHFTDHKTHQRSDSRRVSFETFRNTESKSRHRSDKSKNISKSRDLSPRRRQSSSTVRRYKDEKRSTKLLPKRLEQSETSSSCDDLEQYDYDPVLIVDPDGACIEISRCENANKKSDSEEESTESEKSLASVKLEITDASSLSLSDHEAAVEIAQCASLVMQSDANEVGDYEDLISDASETSCLTPTDAELYNAEYDNKKMSINADQDELLPASEETLFQINFSSLDCGITARKRRSRSLSPNLLFEIEHKRRKKLLKVTELRLTDKNSPTSIQEFLPTSEFTKMQKSYSMEQCTPKRALRYLPVSATKAMPHLNTFSLKKSRSLQILTLKPNPNLDSNYSSKNVSSIINSDRNYSNAKENTCTTHVTNIMTTDYQKDQTSTIYQTSKIKHQQNINDTESTKFKALRPNIFCHCTKSLRKSNSFPSLCSKISCLDINALSAETASVHLRRSNSLSLVYGNNGKFNVQNELRNATAPLQFNSLSSLWCFSSIKSLTAGITSVNTSLSKYQTKNLQRSSSLPPVSRKDASIIAHSLETFTTNTPMSGCCSITVSNPSIIDISAKSKRGCHDVECNLNPEFLSENDLFEIDVSTNRRCRSLSPHAYFTAALSSAKFTSATAVVSKPVNAGLEQGFAVTIFKNKIGSLKFV